MLVLLATAGMMMMISANDLIALYLGLELQSLALYVLASFDRDSAALDRGRAQIFRPGRARLGHAALWRLAGLRLRRHHQFRQPGEAVRRRRHAVGIGLIIGIVFIAVGLAFKVSAVPFHMWTPDVYEGAPTPVTAFFSVAPKIAALVLFVRVMVEPFGGLLAEWRQIIWVRSRSPRWCWAPSPPSTSSNIKRLMAYSSIGHVGYALIGLAAGTAAGVRGVLVYMAIYLFMNVGTFAVILCMRRAGQDGRAHRRSRRVCRAPIPAWRWRSASSCSRMAGIPPLAGFFAKLYIFLAAIDAGLYALAVIGVLASVVGAFYYLRIVKLMYFDEPQAARSTGRSAREVQAVMLVTGAGDHVLLRLARSAGRRRRRRGRGACSRDEPDRRSAARFFRLLPLASVRQHQRRGQAPRPPTARPRARWCGRRNRPPGADGAGRAWVSPPGNLHLSLVLRPDCAAAAGGAAWLRRGARGRRGLRALPAAGRRARL